MAGEYPDVVIGCVGGGSNFGGICLPFLRDKIKGDKKNLEAIAVEPASCPTLTKGKFAYDFGDEAGFTPLLKMYTLGHNFIPAKIHAGGLRYHGAAPLISLLVNIGLIKAESYFQKEVFDSAKLFAQEEGIVPAPESAHAIKSVVEQAKKCKVSGEKKVILFNLSGHGLLDLAAYDAYLQNHLEDHEMTKDEIDENLKVLPEVVA
jgi:tryptophan synthase beta chain